MLLEILSHAFEPLFCGRREGTAAAEAELSCESARKLLDFGSAERQAVIGPSASEGDQ
jgi:hypothetical protein